MCSIYTNPCETFRNLALRIAEGEIRRSDATATLVFQGYALDPDMQIHYVGISDGSTVQLGWNE